MKKILAILVTCASILTTCAFSGCGLLTTIVTSTVSSEYADSSSGDSDEVTEDEWRTAFSDDRMLNLTIRETYDYERISYSFDATYKYALTDNASYVSGKTYEYYDENNEYGSEYIGEEYTTYTLSSTESVSKTNHDGSIYWHGEKTDPTTLSDASSYYDAVGGCYLWFTILEKETDSETDTRDAYSLFTYENGSYVYTEEFDDGYYTITVNFSNGYVSGMSFEYNFTRNGEFKAGDYIIYSAVFSDYGTTTVTVPEDYTYEYYLANYAE